MSYLSIVARELREDFDEGKHPREEDGKFAAKGGGSKRGSSLFPWQNMSDDDLDAAEAEMERQEQEEFAKEDRLAKRRDQWPYYSRADFDEGKHPRDKAGRFARKKGGSARQSGLEGGAVAAEPKVKIDPSRKVAGEGETEVYDNQARVIGVRKKLTDKEIDKIVGKREKTPGGALVAYPDISDDDFFAIEDYQTGANKDRFKDRSPQEQDDEFDNYSAAFFYREMRQEKEAGASKPKKKGWFSWDSAAITPRGQYELRRRLGLTHDSVLEYTGNPRNDLIRELRKDFARAWSE